MEKAGALKTWSLLYLVIWISFLQILIILFPVFGSDTTYELHFVVGVVVVGLTYAAYSRVKKTSCPDRIKRITKATATIAIVQGFLGIVLFLADRLGVGVPFTGFIVFIHAVLAITIITQASSSSTAYDMWEEKEFEAPVTKPA
jgi:hypothetical protein